MFGFSFAGSKDSAVGNDGIGEFIIDWGPGYRLYLAKDGDALIVLFGGDKGKR